MPRKRLDIGDKLHLPGPRCCPANTARERDHKAPVSTLIGPDFQQFRCCHTVEPGPVKTVIAVMHLAGDGGHQGDCIVFAFGQGFDRAGKFSVIDVHVMSFIRRGRGLLPPKVRLRRTTPEDISGKKKQSQTRSIAMAVPSPPPMQMAATPRLRPRVSSAFKSVTMIRAPDAPIG